MAKNHRKIGPNLARHRLRALDHRSAYVRLWRDIRHELTEQLGVEPSAGQHILIVEVADTVVRCTVLAERLLTADVSEAAAQAERRYNWWSERTRRMLQALGLDRKPTPAPTLSNYLAGKGTGAE